MTARAYVCPACHSEELQEISRVIIVQPVKVSRDEAGRVDQDYGSVAADVYWDSAETTGAQCVACGWESSGPSYVDELVASPARGRR